MGNTKCFTCKYIYVDGDAEPCASCTNNNSLWEPQEPEQPIEQPTEQPAIKDSGERREFETGAVRDMQAGKGRCDLMPLDIVGRVADIGDELKWYKNESHEQLSGNHYTTNQFINCIHRFQSGRSDANIRDAIGYLLAESTQGVYDILLELSKHFENGAKKYGERNWEKGIAESSYIDSAVRHYLKYKAGWNDEPHYIACLWNLVALWWTHENIASNNKEKSE